MGDLKIIYLSLTCTPPHTKWGLKVGRSQLPSWRSPWRPHTDYRIHTGHLHSSPSLIYTHRHTRVLRGVACLLRQRCVECEVCIHSHSFLLSSNKGMLAPVLLHRYSEEVRSKFCCLVLQLIANRMSVALRNIQPRAGSQNIQCNYANTNITVF